jgi:hypothetical protein
MAQVVRGLKKGPALYHIRRPLYYSIVVAGPKPFVFYPLKGQASSTVVPCMNSMWYKCLNGVDHLLGFGGICACCTGDYDITDRAGSHVLGASIVTNRRIQNP